MLRADHPRHPRGQIRLVLKEVQMPPRMALRVMHLAAGRAALRAREASALPEVDPQIQPTPRRSNWTSTTSHGSSRPSACRTAEIIHSEAPIIAIRARSLPAPRHHPLRRATSRRDPRRQKSYRWRLRTGRLLSTASRDSRAATSKPVFVAARRQPGKASQLLPSGRSKPQPRSHNGNPRRAVCGFRL